MSVRDEREISHFRSLLELTSMLGPNSHARLIQKSQSKRTAIRPFLDRLSFDILLIKTIDLGAALPIAVALDYNSQMEIKLWGVRGSLPAPLKPAEVERRIAQTLRDFISKGHREISEIEGYLAQLPPAKLGGFGGNTPCIEINSPNSHIIIDAGSGLRALGNKLMAGPHGQGKGRVDFLMTHFHWDHLIGLPFFAPLFVKGNQIHFHAVQEELSQMINTVFKRPFFPLDVVQIPSTFSFHQLKPREQVSFGDMKVTPYQLDHPDPCWGYKIEHEGRVFSHCVDSESHRLSQMSWDRTSPFIKTSIS